MDIEMENKFWCVSKNKNGPLIGHVFAEKDNIPKVVIVYDMKGNIAILEDYYK